MEPKFWTDEVQALTFGLILGFAFGAVFVMMYHPMKPLTESAPYGVPAVQSHG